MVSAWRKVGLIVIVLGFAGRFVPAAVAQGLPEDEPWRYSEVRIGVLAHDVRLAGGVEGGADLNAEITSPSLLNPDWSGGAPLWVQWVLHPRAQFGVEPNLNGKTNQLYAGLTWSAVLGRRIVRADDALEFRFLFGPALNDGEHRARSWDRKSLGSNVLFHLGGELSYRLTPRWAIGVYFDHSSNGGFARYNASLNDLGVRIGYRF